MSGSSGSYPPGPSGSASTSSSAPTRSAANLLYRLEGPAVTKTGKDVIFERDMVSDYGISYPWKTEKGEFNTPQDWKDVPVYRHQRRALFRLRYRFARAIAGYSLPVLPHQTRAQYISRLQTFTDSTEDTVARSWDLWASAPQHANLLDFERQEATEQNTDGTKIRIRHNGEVRDREYNQAEYESLLDTCFPTNRNWILQNGEFNIPFEWLQEGRVPTPGPTFREWRLTWCSKKVPKNFLGVLPYEEKDEYVERTTGSGFAHPPENELGLRYSQWAKDHRKFVIVPCKAKKTS